MVKMQVLGTKNNKNYIIMGAPGTGKTVLLGKLEPSVDKKTGIKDKLAIISTDNNALPDTAGFQCSSYDDVLEAKKELLNNPKIEAIAIDVFDDVFSFCEAKAMTVIGMKSKSDPKGNYGNLAKETTDIVQKTVLRELMDSDKRLYVIMHTSVDDDGDHIPMLSSYHSESKRVLNWILGRCEKQYLCLGEDENWEPVMLLDRTKKDED